MPLTIEKSKGFPEVFTSSAGTSAVVSKAVKAGRLRKIASRLYTTNLTDDPAKIVRRNWYSLVKGYFPDALVADRTALENCPAPDGSVFLVSAGTREVVLPGIVFRPRRGPGPLESDAVFLDIRVSSTPRAWLENMRESRSRGRATRTLSKQEIEVRLDALLRQGGGNALNRLRDDARPVAEHLGMREEFRRLDGLIGSFLGTRDVELETPVGRARKDGFPFDPDRQDLFLKLFSELRSSAPVVRPVALASDVARTNFAFFEAYFSNYIEGTEFEVDEAVDIIFNGVIPTHRPEDAHDILGTYRVISDYQGMARVPADFDAFVSLLTSRHASIMEMRPTRQPGVFKDRENRAGDTVFVSPDLVIGTLRKGFEVYQGLEVPLHRAVFMMFLVSEVHPFVDGNGRVARVMMNAELLAAGEQKIIIPTVFRDNCVAALKALSQTGNATPLVRVSDFAQRYALAVRWDDFAVARADLEQTHAFLKANEAEERGLRLVLPRTGH